ncbi:hypothetical protein [Candidatus Nitrosotenuis sp. DW1]|uniref:hypothetical protein n=1 Tax=Candidatus Nitrosotenuis sp. DW1 TaxID=2259672 RepID=UPI0015CB3081|nr:hypothetical protein [Candidatus Nitrosotenuis sp. DW1]QLH08711.1 hypothetical protein DSQ19_03725 [Candidatus Nitrosotenuis sp. DW1]
MSTIIQQNMANSTAIKIIAIAAAFLLLSSVAATSAFGENTSKEKTKVKSTDKKEGVKKTIQDKIKKTAKQPTTKKPQTDATNPTSQTNTTIQQAKPAIDPFEAQKSACKQKETEREQYECEKALRSTQSSEDFKQKSKKHVVGPVTFYYPGAKVEKSGNVHILNLKFLVENTGSKDNVALYCTGPAACNYDISDGKATYKYAANDFTSGQIVLRPGMSKEMNIMFGPAIGYGSYVPFKYDPTKQYTFNVKESWGTATIPLDLK